MYILALKLEVSNTSYGLSKLATKQDKIVCVCVGRVPELRSRPTCA